MNHVRFKFLTGDVHWWHYGGKWVSQKRNNGEFDYWLVIQFENMWEATGDETGAQYHVQLNVVSPEQAGEDNLKKATDGYGMAEEDITDLIKVEALDSYGVHAVIWQGQGPNRLALLKAARRVAQISDSLFGFYMDRPNNRIGTTGWEALSGDIQSGLARAICSGSTEGRILGKMHGLSGEQIDEAVRDSANPAAQR